MSQVNVLVVLYGRPASSGSLLQTSLVHEVVERPAMGRRRMTMIQDTILFPLYQSLLALSLLFVPGRLLLTVPLK